MPKRSISCVGGESPALFTALDFAFCFGVVCPDRGMVFFGEFGNGFKKRAAGRIFGVETEQIRGAVGEFVDIVIHLFENFRAVDEVVETAGKNGAESGVDRGRDAVFLLDVHVEIGGDAARQIFHDAEDIEPVNVVPGELCLVREDLALEPFVEREIVRVGAEEGHRGVRVCVFKARDQEIAAGVNFAVEDSGLCGIWICFSTRSDIGDGVAGDMKFVFGDGKMVFSVEYENFGVVKTCIQKRSLLYFTCCFQRPGPVF